MGTFTTNGMMIITGAIAALFTYFVLAAGLDVDSVARNFSGTLAWTAGILGLAAAVTLWLPGNTDAGGKKFVQRLLVLCIGTGFIAFSMWPNALAPLDSISLLLIAAFVVALFITLAVLPKADLPATTDGLFILAMTIILGGGVFVWKLGFGYFWAVHPAAGMLISISALLLSFAGMRFVHNRASRFPAGGLIV